MKVISLAHECVPEFDNTLKKITYIFNKIIEKTLIDYRWKCYKIAIL